MNDEENIIVRKEDSQVNDNLISKGKKMFKKHKNKILIVGGLVLLTNGITGEVIRKISYNKGIAKGTDMVMNNPSMLGKGLRALRKTK